MAKKNDRVIRDIIKRMQREYVVNIKSAKKQVNAKKSRLEIWGFRGVVLSLVLFISYHGFITVTSEVIPWVCEFLELTNPFSNMIQNYSIKISACVSILLLFFYGISYIGIQKSKEYYDEMENKRIEILEKILKKEMAQLKICNEFELLYKIIVSYDGVAIKSKLIACALNIFFICIPILQFPSYDRKDGLGVLVVFIIINYLNGTVTNWAIEKTKEPTYFYNILIYQYPSSKIKNIGTDKYSGVIDFGREIKLLEERKNKLAKEVSEKNTIIQTLRNDNLKLKQDNAKMQKKIKKRKKKNI